jgi:hypothetical protein
MVNALQALDGWCNGSSGHSAFATQPAALYRFVLQALDGWCITAGYTR